MHGWLSYDRWLWSTSSALEAAHGSGRSVVMTTDMKPFTAARRSPWLKWCDISSLLFTRLFLNVSYSSYKRLRFPKWPALYQANIIHRMKWRHSNLWSRYDLHVVGMMSYCAKLTAEDLPRTYVRPLFVKCPDLKNYGALMYEKPLSTDNGFAKSILPLSGKFTGIS